MIGGTEIEPARTLVAESARPSAESRTGDDARRSRVRRMSRAAGTVALGLLGAACASAAPDALVRQPYRVVLLPVEGGAAALAAPTPVGGEGEPVPFSLTAEQLERIVFDGVRASDAFSEILAAPHEVRAARGEFAGDELAAAAEYARRANADLILRITIKSARIRDLGNNGASFWSGFLWFMLPAPIWTVDDRTYDANLAVEAALYEPRDVVKPTASVVASSGLQDLDLWDRGLSWWIPLVPPPFLAGDPETVSETVTRRAVDQLMAELSRELRTREIPSRFELDIQASADGVVVTVTTRRQLRSLEVFADGKLVRAWAETELVPESGATAERRVYRRAVPVPAAGADVRVVAEDEAGGREVRTVRVGGAK